MTFYSAPNNLQHITFNHAQAVANLIDCPTDNMNELVNCLKVFTFTFYGNFSQILLFLYSILY